MSCLMGDDANFDKVVDAFEQAALWRLALSSTIQFNQFTLQQMLDNTNGTEKPS